MPPLPPPRPTSQPMPRPTPRPTSRPPTVPWDRIVAGEPTDEFTSRPPAEHAFEHADTECDGWSTERLTLRTASVRGDKHRYYRQPRQDAVRTALHEATGNVVFAVADGVSGAAHSELGAQEACRAVVEALLHQLTTNQRPLDLRAAVHHAAARMHELTRWMLGLAPTEQQNPDAVARLVGTTLVAGVIRPDPEGAVVGLCRVGDSGAWIFDRAGRQYRPVFRSKTGNDVDFVSNEVAPMPLVSDQLEEKVQHLTAYDTLLVGTDGFGDPLGDGDGPVGDLFAAVLSNPPPPLWFAHALDFSKATFDDDRTLLAVWPTL